jgi:galactose-1-phosphate uridylyltransferase
MFRKEVEESMILYPDGKMEKARVEIRYDPLTLQTSRIVQKTPPFAELEEGEDPFCPFCDGVIEKVAARSPVLRDGIAWRGEAAIFSNITPYSRYSFVVRLTRSHSPAVEDFRTSHFRDALMLIKETMSLIDCEDSHKYYHFAGINYLKSAGGSVRHPHMQYIASQIPTNYFLRLDEKAREFYEKAGVDYWTWLVEAEKEGERYVGETNGVDWVAAFAPKGFYHLIGVCSERTLAEMKKESLEGIGQGIIRYMSFLKSKSMNAYNASIFFADGRGEHFRTHIHLVARTPMSRFYWNDTFFMKIIHDESIVYTLPEAFAAEFRGFWDGG